VEGGDVTPAEHEHRARLAELAAELLEATEAVRQFLPDHPGDYTADWDDATRAAWVKVTQRREHVTEAILDAQRKRRDEVAAEALTEAARPARLSLGGLRSLTLGGAEYTMAELAPWVDDAGEVVIDAQGRAVRDLVPGEMMTSTKAVPWIPGQPLRTVEMKET
jgi:hypothetical protein